MPKQSTRAEVNNFIQGLITEASPLNYPPNASIDEQNFELNRDGTRDRRLGFGYEPSYGLVPLPTPVATLPSSPIYMFKWMNVGGVNTREFAAVQSANIISFFDLNASSISGTGFISTITLSSFPSDVIYSMASVEGNLIVVAGVDTVAQVVYNGTAFTVTYESIKVRDSWGVQVTGLPQYETDTSYRGAYDPVHYYNLQNQSWGVPRKNSNGTVVDPTIQYATDLAVYPSNSETVWTGLQFQPVTAGVTFERMYTNLYTELIGSSTVATQGYYIIDLLRRGTSRMLEFANNRVKYPALTYASVTLPSDTTAGGAKAVTEYAGRIWYSGFSGEVTGGDKRSPNLSNYIAFSRLIRSQSDFNKCYQEGDPSSRDTTDLVDTDGGVIRIAGAKKIIALLNLSHSLVVIADNGVWTVSGGSDYGFTSTNYIVKRISTYGGLSPASAIVEGGKAFYWSDSGIFVIAKSQMGDLTVENITQTTVQTLYENIPPASKASAVGAYDAVSKKIRWLYKEGVRFNTSSVTKELVLDTVINAFYINTISNLSTNSVEVFGMITSSPFKRGTSLTSVYAVEDLVYVGTEAVGASETVRETGLQSLRYLTIQLVNGVASMTFSYHNNTDFIDWKETDGVGKDAKAYLLTGHQTAGDSAIAKQIPYLDMYFRRTEKGVTLNLEPDYQSGCLMRSQWDFSNTIASNKWSPLVQVYRYRRAQYITGVDDTYDNGFEVVVSKNKLRGRGKTFALYLETEPLKDCRILGWNISVNGNPNV